MKKEMRRSGAQINYTQRNYMQGNHHKEAYSRQKNQQYRELSSGYYMYTANAVARDYQYEEAMKTLRTNIQFSCADAAYFHGVYRVFAGFGAGRSIHHCAELGLSGQSV